MKPTILASAAIAAAVLAAGGSASRAAFTPGTLQILQVGDGTLPFANNVAQVASVQTYDLATGSLLASTPLGIALSSRNDDHDGHLNFTASGQYLTVGGYVAEPGSAYPVTTSDPRAIARIDGSGNVATVSFSSIYAGQTINAVASIDGAAFFSVGSGPDANSKGGLYYIPSLDAGSTPINVSQHQSGSTADSFRNARIVNGQLMINTPAQGSFTNRGAYTMTIAGGLPVAPADTPSVANPFIINTEGTLTDPYGNTNPDTTGKLYPKSDIAAIDSNNDGTIDLAYSTGGKEDLEKWVLTDGTKWIRTDTIDAPSVAVPGGNNEINAIDYRITPDGVELFLANDFGIWRFIDGGGTGGAALFASGDLSSGTDSNGRRFLTTDYFISPGENEQFRGLAVSPVPEPSTLALFAIALGGVLARQRRNA